jgi:hypothetical protein
VGEQTGAPGTRAGGLRLLLVLLGAVMIIGGVWVLADNYAADYDCVNELRCHNEGSRSPSAADRAAAALGFGLEHPRATGDPLPGPEGTILVAAGVACWLGALLLRPPRRRGVDALPSTVHPLSTEQQLAQYERLRDRGTLTDAEFEVRRDRLLGARVASRADAEPSS